MAKPKLPAATKRTAAAAKTKATVSKRTTRSNARPDVNTADGGDETLVQRAVNRLTRTFDRNHLSGLAPAFLELRRKDIQAVVDANKMSYEGLQRVVQRQAQVLKATIGEYQAVVGVMRRAGPAESVDKLDELARGGFQDGPGQPHGVERRGCPGAGRCVRGRQAAGARQRRGGSQNPRLNWHSMPGHQTP